MCISFFFKSFYDNKNAVVANYDEFAMVGFDSICKDLALGMEKLGENWASVFAPIISFLLLAMDLSSAYNDQLRKV